MPDNAPNRFDTIRGIYNSPPMQATLVAAPPKIPIDSVKIDDDSMKSQRSSAMSVMPSWLLSLVTHLAIFILFASSVFPTSNRSGLSVLLMGFSTEMIDSDVSITIFPNAIDDPIEFDVEAVVEPIETKTNSITVGSDPLAHDEKLNSTKTAQRNPQFVSFEPLGRFASSVVTAVRNDRAQAEYDDIVDQFIQYDLGKLRGAKGQTARKRFESLGTDSIPALVRGINKSARYHGSCPVAVMTSKLSAEVSRASNPDLIRYAIDNLGEGVAWDMPHADRVLALRTKLQQEHGETDFQIESVVESMGLSLDVAEQVKGIMRLNDTDLISTLANASETENQLATLIIVRMRFSRLAKSADLGLAVTKSLESKDPKVQEISATLLGMLKPGKHLGSDRADSPVWRLYWQCQADKGLLIRSLLGRNRANHMAAVELYVKSEMKLVDRQKTNIARAILPNLDSESDKLKDVTNKALVKLASGANFGTSRSVWKSYWDEYQRSKIDGPVGMSRLRSANALLSNGKTEAARKYLTRIIDQFPRTPAAEEAQRQLDRIN